MQKVTKANSSNKKDNKAKENKESAKKQKISNVKTFKNGAESNLHFYTDVNYNRWSFGLTDEEKETISEYTGDRYSDVNEYLRQGDTSDKKYAKKAIKILDNVIDKFELTKPIKVYRAISPEIAEKIKDTYIDKAFQSSTTNMDMFKNDTNRANKPLLVLNIPKGKGRGAYINEHSLYKDKEYEFLIRRNSKFKVRNRKNENGKTIIEMDLVED